MKSGRLKDLVVIKKQVETRNELNQRIKSYDKVFKAKANVQVLSGSELIKAGVELTREYLSILMRYDTRIKHEYKLFHNGSMYDVESIKPNDRKMDMVITASRLVNG